MKPEILPTRPHPSRFKISIMNINKPERGLFITGTDTEVGKTYAASLIAKSLVKSGHSVGVYKPIASDCIRDEDSVYSSDAVALWESAGRPMNLDQVCPQRFEAPIAPHLAAQAENREVDSDLLRTGIEVWKGNCDIILVEGAGGLMSPVNDDEYFADLAFDFGYPLIVVVPNVLGCINQTMQTLITATTFRDGLDIAGIVLNNVRTAEGDQSVSSNYEQITKRSLVPILGTIGYRDEQFSEEVDWFEVADQFTSVG